MASKEPPRSQPASPEPISSPITPSTIGHLGDNPIYKNQWMEFAADKGKFYHNFATNKTTMTLNPSMNIVTAPVAMKHSGNMLRERSEYMPRLLR